MFKFLYAIIVAFTCFCCHAQVADPSQPREKLSLDKGWKFYEGDIPFPIIKGHNESYGNAKAGKAWGAAAPEYNDNSWRTVNLPHDWAVEGGFDSTENLSQGYRKRGMGWYRRRFKLNASDKGKNLELQFDAIATHCTVWFNGTVVHRNWSGYTSFYIDITAMAKYGDDINTIAIQVNAVDQEGWWYEGAGIYRHTWLVKRSPTHIVTDGVFAQPIKNKMGNWEIPVEISIANSGKINENVEVETSVFDKANNLMAKNSALAMANVLQTNKAAFNIPINNPTLWSLENPALYKVVTVLKKEGKIIDNATTACGFRTIRFDADAGFFLNDKHVKIQGVCNHQDHAGVGVAVPDALWEFRLRRLKEMGVNGYRCAHNPPAAEFLEACDSLGMLVMDENRNFNTSLEYIRQLQWMVRRDRNHSSIILWSVFNEEPMQGTENGYEMVREMSARVKDLDTTRPVTAAQSGGQFSAINVSAAVDVVGFNYQMGSYDRFHKEHPTMKLTSSEDVSGLMERGEYVTDKKKNLIDAYDDQRPSWGSTHRNAWKMIDQRPYLAGCFVWTGFDYRGEPTPYQWPSAGSFFGIMDQCGFPKTAFWLHQAQWRNDINVLQLVPHWNWPVDSIGKKMKVMSLSNADSVMVVLNGKKMGGQKVDKYEMNTWDIPYQPGKLEAIGYKNGKEISRFKTETTGAPVALQLIPYRKTLANDGQDAMPITVQALDDKGRLVPTANVPIEFEVTGGGKIIGLGNGDPNSHEPEKGNKRSMFNGLAQVIIQTNEGGTEPIKLVAKSAGLKTAETIINLDAVPIIPFVETVQPVLLLDQWRMSQMTATRPDPNQKLEENDQNSWLPVKPGQLQEMSGGRFVIYRSNFTFSAEQQKKGGDITFKKLAGKAEIWLNGKMIAQKNDAAQADFTATVLTGNKENILSVLIESEPKMKIGFGGVVTVK